MVYKVIITARAEADFRALLTNYEDRYTALERLQYVEQIRVNCQALDFFPKRVKPMAIKGREYWRIFYKAHTVYYRVFDESQTVEIEAVLRGSMLPELHM